MVRRVEILLFATLFLTFAYFHHSRPGWNVNSRFALTLALVDQGTVRIDDYYKNPATYTEDVASRGDHFYSDKVFGTSLLGVPALALIRAMEAATGSRLPMDLVRHLVTMLSVGLLAALSGVLLYRILLLFDGRGTDAEAVQGAFCIVAITFFGTLLFFYSTLFMGYLPAQFFALAAFYTLERRFRAKSKTLRATFGAGLLMGCALLCEYTMAIAAGLVGLYLIAQTKRLMPAGLYGVAIILALLPFFAYTYAIFGSFSIPYQYEISPLFSRFMKQGIMGVTAPKPEVLFLTTFHPYRGLFVHSPFLILAFWGIARMWRDSSHKFFSMLVAALLVCYLMFNAGYYMWWGGYSFGPRHLAPLIPFLAIPLIAVWRARPAKILVLLLGAVAIALHLVVNSIEPQYPDTNRETRLEDLLVPNLSHRYTWRFLTEIWPMFLHKPEVIDANIGQLMGFDGPSSLLPLLLFWILMAGTMIALTRRDVAQPMKA